MNSLFAELKRRNIFRVAGAYVVVAWLTMQVISVMTPALNLPDWVDSFFAISFIAGFPIALLFAWAFELTPDGVKRTEPVHAEDSVREKTSRKLDFAILGGLGLVAALILGTSLFSEANSSPDAAPITVTENETPISATGTSIAVLPFADMSAASDQEYFSDGMAEEILNALVRVPDLQVAGRTSSFAFKGRNMDMREIGATLNVAHILEGSVRKQGERVRITAQLIRASDGFHLWSDTYDGTLDNIFDLQEDISRAIAGELQVLFTIDDQTRLTAEVTDNQEAYDLYLRGRSLLYSSTEEEILQSRDFLEQAVALDPNFVEAWVGLVYANSIASGYIGTISQSDFIEKLNFAANKAATLNPQLADVFHAQAIAQAYANERAGALDNLKKAIDLQPNNTGAYQYYGLQLTVLGRNQDAVPILKRAIEIDPLNPFAWLSLAHAYQNLGEYDKAEAAAVRTIDLGNIGGYQLRADNALIRGDTDKSVQYIMDVHALASAQLTADMGARHLWEAGARAMYKDSTNDQMALRGVLSISLQADEPEINAVTMGLLARLGMTEDVFRLFHLSGGTTAPLAATFWSDLEWARDLRQHPKFPDFAESEGYVAAWQQHGWPDKCKPNASTDGSDGQFTCN